MTLNFFTSITIWSFSAVILAGLLQAEKLNLLPSLSIIGSIFSFHYSVDLMYMPNLNILIFIYGSLTFAHFEMKIEL